MYKAYNQMSKNGKNVGRAYVVDSGTNRTKLRNEVERSNRYWNKSQVAKKGNIKVKLAGIIKK